MAALTLRLVRLAKATALLCRAGLAEESLLQARSATESIVNLLYIMLVGPKVDGAACRDLARRFNAYGDVEYWKMLDARPQQARAAHKRRLGWTDAQMDAFMIEKKRLSDEAKSRLGCTSTRWHTLNLVSMARRVRDNAPAYVLPEIADVAFSSFVSANSATHTGALSLRTEYKAHGNEPLEFVCNESNVTADVVANMAVWAWKTMAEYYVQGEVVQECLNRHMLAELRSRYESAPSAVIAM